MNDLTAEQRQLVKLVHDFGYRYPLTENGDAQLLLAIWVPLNG